MQGGAQVLPCKQAGSRQHGAGDDGDEGLEGPMRARGKGACDMHGVAVGGGNQKRGEDETGLRCGGGERGRHLQPEDEKHSEDGGERRGEAEGWALCRGVQMRLKDDCEDGNKREESHAGEAGHGRLSNVDEPGRGEEESEGNPEGGERLCAPRPWRAAKKCGGCGENGEKSQRQCACEEGRKRMVCGVRQQVRTKRARCPEKAEEKKRGGVAKWRGRCGPSHETDENTPARRGSARAARNEALRYNEDWAEANFFAWFCASRARSFSFMAIPATQMRPGMIIKHNDQLHLVFKVEHRTPGNLRAFIQAKLRNLKSGAMFEHRFRSADAIEKVVVDEVDMEFLYSDGDDFYFMNPVDFEQTVLKQSTLGEAVEYLTPNLQIKVSYFDGDAVGIELPTYVELTVVETEPGLKSATASSVTKPAKTETGLVVQVPPFINEGERIRVDTSEGAYMSRA